MVIAEIMNFRHVRRAQLSAILLLAALVFRAYIPAGFMPASGTPFLLELCPAYGGGAPSPHEHHHHSQGHAKFQDCPFGSAPVPGPASHVVAFAAAGRISSWLPIPVGRGAIATRLFRAHQPRGPPAPV
jgi:hypothetical protein